MCILSDKIKFCTCATTDVEKLKHYWKLYRFDKNKKLLYMGSPMFPTSEMDPNFIINNEVLLNRLNDRDAFDSPLEVLCKDLIEIVIKNNVKGIEPFTYSFKFIKGTWKAVDEDSFEIMNNYDKEQSGNIKAALNRKI